MPGQPYQGVQQNLYFQGQPQFAQDAGQPLPSYQTPQQAMQPGVEPNPGMEIPASDFSQSGTDSFS